MNPTQETEKRESIKKTSTPLKSIRRYCLWCMNNQAIEVNLCPDRECPLFDLRMGKRVEGMRPLKQIRQRCKVCSESLEDIKTACSMEMILLNVHSILIGWGKILN